MPIAFGALIRQLGKVPWSLGPGRPAGVAEIEARARARGLPPVRRPDGWPAFWGDDRLEEAAAAAAA